MGPSGSGNSTFMNLIGCLDRATSGIYLLDGIDIIRQQSMELASLRNQKIGFQGFNLSPRMDALDNVMLPMVYAGVSARVRQGRGLGSLLNAPSLILADEPTGNLVSRTSEEILATLQRLNQAGATIVLVTHEPDIASYCSRTVVFKDGLSSRTGRIPAWRLARW